MSNYLQLADPGQLADAPMMLSEEGIMELYVNVPTEDGGVLRVREDYFDTLPRRQWLAVMDYLEQFQDNQEISGLFSGMKERRAVRKEERQAKKAIDPETGMTQKQTFKLAKQTQRGGTIGKVLDVAKGVFGIPTTDNMPQQYKDFDMQGGVDFGYDQPQTQPTDYKKIIIVGGLILAVVGTAVYVMSKKKKS